MKIIFLDLDGIVNYYNWYLSDYYKALKANEDPDIDPKCIKRLNEICEKTNAKIVISSSWKIASGYKDRLEKAGLNNIIGKTPDLIWLDRKDYCRGWEIDSWLQIHLDVENYIILDDRTDFYEEQLEHFIQIDPKYGLTDEQALIAINMLNSNFKLDGK